MKSKTMAAAALATAVLILALLPISAFAASGPTFSVASEVPAMRGGSVTVPIITSNNPGFVAAGMVVTYDTNVLEITNVTAAVAEMPLNAHSALTSNPGIQRVHLVDMNLSDWSGTGVIVNLTFNVRSDAPIGTSTIGLSFSGSPDGTPANREGTLLTGSAAFSGSVHVFAGDYHDSDGGDNDGSGSGYGGGSQAQAQTQQQQQPPDDGSFIGSTYIEDGASPAGAAEGSGSGVSGSAQQVPTDFGRVPQTGVPDIRGLFVTMLVSFLATSSLCVYQVRRILHKRKQIARIDRADPQGF